MTLLSPNRPGKHLDIAVHFCQTCGVIGPDRESIEGHLADPANAACQTTWNAGSAQRNVRFRMLRFRASTGDVALKVAVQAATPLPEFDWIEATVL